MENTKIGFIGAGNMAQAVVKGLQSSGKDFNLAASATKDTSMSYQKMKSLGVDMHVKNSQLCNCHVIVIAVKPYLVAKVMEDIKKHLESHHVIVSLAAGVKLADLSKCVPADVGLVRASITTSVSIRSGVTTMVATPTTTPEQKESVTNIFSLIGHCEMVEDENFVNYNTTFCGSGVAYMCMALEAYADGGVLIGLQRKKAIELAAKTMIGSAIHINTAISRLTIVSCKAKKKQAVRDERGTAKMVLETGQHPGELKDAVCSPRGLTILGVQNLERSSFRSSIIDAIEVAYRGRS